MKRIIKIIIVLLFISSSALSQDYSISVLPFCSNYYDEFGPVYYKDGIAFSSNRKNKVLVTYTSERNNKPLFDLYQVEQLSRTDWGAPELLSKELRSNFHDGPATFNGRENRVYFTRNIEYRKKLGNSINRKNRLGIFYARYSGGEFKNVRPFDYNSEDYNVTHPSLNAEGDVLFFASDMPGGYGGSDLYVSRYENRQWTEPENLGSVINTEGDELFPFYHKSGKLYFASDEHNSMGRLDVFYTEKVNGEWHVPFHMEEPINSRYDDFGLIMDDFGKAGLFTSDRRGTDDIYSFVSLFPIFENIKKMEKNSYCYEFYEAGNAGGDTVTFKYEWDLGDGTKKRGNLVDHCFDTTGTYMVQLNVIDGLTGDIMYSQASYLVEVENVKQVYINSPDTVYVGREVQFDGHKTNIDDFEIEEYYWDFGDGRRTRGVEATHVYTAPGNYIVQLGVMGPENNEGDRPKQGVYKNIVVETPEE